MCVFSFDDYVESVLLAGTHVFISSVQLINIILFTIF